MQTQHPFPRPTRLSTSTTRWALSDVVRYEAEIADTIPRPIEQERWLAVRQVAQRFGVSVATIWRWSADAAANREVSA